MRGPSFAPSAAPTAVVVGRLLALGLLAQTRKSPGVSTPRGPNRSLSTRPSSRRPLARKKTTMPECSVTQNPRPFKLSAPTHVSFAAADRVPDFHLPSYLVAHHGEWCEDTEARQGTDRQLRVQGGFPLGLRQGLRTLSREAADAMSTAEALRLARVREAVKHDAANRGRPVPPYLHGYHARRAMTISESFAISACLTRGLPSLRAEADALVEAKQELDRLVSRPGVDVGILLLERKVLDDLRLQICPGECQPETVNVSIPAEQFKQLGDLSDVERLGLPKWQLLVLAVAVCLSEQNLPSVLRNQALATWETLERRVRWATKKAQLAVAELGNA